MQKQSFAPSIGDVVRDRLYPCVDLYFYQKETKDKSTAKATFIRDVKTEKGWTKETFWKNVNVSKDTKKENLFWRETTQLFHDNEN